MTKTKQQPAHISDGEILQNVLNELQITAYQLSQKTGYKSPTSIYHIINGINSITLEMAKNICAVYPQVNFLYLTLGKEPVLLNQKQQEYQNLDFEEVPRFEDIPELLKDIRDLLFEINSKV